MMNKFRVIDYITRKRKICRDLMINHKIPQYCFDYLYIRKNIPEGLHISETDAENVYRVYCKGTGFVLLFICDIPIEEIDKDDVQLKHDIMTHCLKTISEHELEKQRFVDSLNDKLNVLIDKKSTLNKLINTNLGVS